ncbi:ergothioneine biosynthesis glutamate--cysteine ligase EgtA [Rhodococcus sp. X156]|uniref:ergothioneine biosynthesis glutamate--cysteine ligase EgtA n=1 Tax=Rhodococcus sp. X156 TaxID=2499145 RepID=UPI0019D2304E|nr:ergothioneine biosynthesis glutamate--cysteine ligase EgtA [Rhodococcus sp. X156]
MTEVATESAPVLRGRTDAEAHVGVVCFKQGPPTLLGAELEWLLAHADHPEAAPAVATVATALGDHAPSSLRPGSPARPLPGGSIVTVEPGGQVELSSAPYPDARSLCSALRSDVEHLRGLLGSAAIVLQPGAAQEHRLPERQLFSPRYCAMEELFDRVGPFGRLMMCSTAAVQVSVDAGEGAEMAARWAMLHEVGPALVAAFACSPRLCGAPDGDWASQRMRTWLELDPQRTVGPPTDTTDPVTAYARWALDVPLLCVQDATQQRWTAPPGVTFADWVDGRTSIGRVPTTVDLDLHLSTLFPPVRAKGHFEVRYLDAQPGDAWQVPVALIDGLLGDAATVDTARDLAAATAGRWRDAAQHGRSDTELRRAATALLELGAQHVSDPSLARQVAAAAERAPADCLEQVRR